LTSGSNGLLVKKLENLENSSSSSKFDVLFVPVPKKKTFEWDPNTYYNKQKSFWGNSGTFDYYDSSYSMTHNI